MIRSSAQGGNIKIKAGISSGRGRSAKEDLDGGGVLIEGGDKSSPLYTGDGGPVHIMGGTTHNHKKHGGSVTLEGGTNAGGQTRTLETCSAKCI